MPLTRYLTVIALALMALLTAAQVARAEGSPFLKHVTIQMASIHTGATRDFNEFNPGLGVGFSTGLGETKFELEADVGFYKNSFSDWSAYAGVGITYELFRPHPRVGVRAGPIAGLAYYPNAQVFRDAGIPTVGDAVVFGGVALFARIDNRIELRSRYLPTAGGADGILSFEMRVKF